MRLWCTLALVLLLCGMTTPARQATPPAQAAAAVDSVAAMLRTLQQAIAGNDLTAFRALLAPDIPELDSLGFETSIISGGVTAATIRERDRESSSGGVTKVLAEFLINRSG